MTDTADAYRIALDGFLAAAKQRGIAQFTQDLVASLALGGRHITTPVLQLGEYADWSIGDADSESPGFIRLDLRGGDATPDELRAALESELTAPDAIFEP